MNIKQMLILVMLFVSIGESRACDVCGCVIGTQQFGIIPQFDRHLVGLRYSYRSFLADHGNNEDSPNEFFNTTEFVSRYVVADDWQVFVSVPYQWSSKQETYGLFETSGLGDITVSAMYSIFKQKMSKNEKWIHNLQVGAGLKLPTGSHSYVNEYQEWYPGLQNGTGCKDLMLNANYIVRQGKLGLATELSYRVNGLNKERDFRFGNRASVSANLFYVHSLDQLSIMPTFGVALEHAVQDEYQNEQVDFSGGHTTSMNIGVQVFTNNLSIGVSAHPVISQNVGDGFIQAKSRVSATMNFFF